MPVYCLSSTQLNDRLIIYIVCKIPKHRDRMNKGAMCCAQGNPIKRNVSKLAPFIPTQWRNIYRVYPLSLKNNCTCTTYISTQKRTNTNNKLLWDSWKCI